MIAVTNQMNLDAIIQAHAWKVHAVDVNNIVQISQTVATFVVASQAT